MPKSELKLKPHASNPGEQIVEIWYQGQVIGEINGGDGSGVRILSRNPMKTTHALGFVIDVLGVTFVTSESHEPNAAGS